MKFKVGDLLFRNDDDNMAEWGTYLIVKIDSEGYATIVRTQSGERICGWWTDKLEEYGFELASEYRGKLTEEEIQRETMNNLKGSVVL